MNDTDLQSKCVRLEYELSQTRDLLDSVIAKLEESTGVKTPVFTSVPVATTTTCTRCRRKLHKEKIE